MDFSDMDKYFHYMKRLAKATWSQNGDSISFFEAFCNAAPFHKTWLYPATHQQRCAKRQAWRKAAWRDFNPWCIFRTVILCYANQQLESVCYGSERNFIRADNSGQVWSAESDILWNPPRRASDSKLEDKVGQAKTLKGVRTGATDCDGKSLFSYPAAQNYA